jgi:hypothetical protein
MLALLLLHRPDAVDIALKTVVVVRPGPTPIPILPSRIRLDSVGSTDFALRRAKVRWILRYGRRAERSALN